MKLKFVQAIVVCIPLICFFSESWPSYLGRGLSHEPQSQQSVVMTFSSTTMAQITMVQKTLREWMSGYAREIRDAKSLKAAAWFLALCFGYGVVHAAGPGHGKTLVSAYFVGNGGTVKQALFFGNLISFTHVGSAVVLVGVLSFLSESFGMSAVSSFSDKLLPVSYFLVFLVGAATLVKTALAARRRVAEASVPSGDTKPVRAATVALALAAGIVPCPGATLVLLFSVNLGILGWGLTGMAALALGMGFTTSMVACLTLGFRSSALSLAGRVATSLRPLQTIFSLGGAFLIATFGLLFFIGSIAPSSVLQ